MIPTETPKKFRREKQTAYIHSLKRHANGDWTAHIVICARAILPDGRAVYGSHIIPLRCRQLGRKKK